MTSPSPAPQADTSGAAYSGHPQKGWVCTMRQIPWAPGLRNPCWQCPPHWNSAFRARAQDTIKDAWKLPAMSQLLQKPLRGNSLSEHLQRPSRNLEQSLRPFENHISAGHRSVTEPREVGDCSLGRDLRSQSSTTPSPPRSTLPQPSPSLCTVSQHAFRAFVPQGGWWTLSLVQPLFEHTILWEQASPSP